MARTNAAQINAKYAARDVLLPGIAYRAIEAAFEDGETRERLVRAALGDTAWSKRLSREELDLIQIRGYNAKGENGFEVTLGDGAVWTISVSAERVR